MKRRELNALCRSTCDLLVSRNNDINGYWGLGVLCRLIVGAGRQETSFRITEPGQLRIFGCELTDSVNWTGTIFSLGIDSIDGRISFLLNGRFNGSNDRYLSTIVIAMRESTRVGMAARHAHCWAHDPSRERRRFFAPLTDNARLDLNRSQ